MAEDAASTRLQRRVSELLGRKPPVFAAATATAASSTITTRRAVEDADFEIASISKGITGLLYADAISRGEVTATTTLGQYLPLGSAPAAELTLESITTHRSGLPRLPKTPQVRRAAMDFARHGTNPYGESLDTLLAQTRNIPVGKPRRKYSNLAFQLLGHALAAAAGTSYRNLLRKRIAEPLRLEHFYAPATTDELRGRALVGKNRRGKRQEPWTGEALAPAGGIRAGIHDMAALATAMLDGSVSGLKALEPVADFGFGVRIGAGWISLDISGRTITWHNGGSGGFRSWMGLDREAGTAIVILSATASSVDRAGFTLLSEFTAEHAE